MYVFWWLVAFLMACSFFVLELKLWRFGVERVYGNKQVRLRGQRWHYCLAAFAIGFIGFMSIMLGLLDYANIRFENLQGTICWLIGSLVVGGVNHISVRERLKYFDFEGD